MRLAVRAAVMVRAIALVVAVSAPAITRADPDLVDRDPGLTQRAVGLGIDGADVDLGSGSATAMGGVITGAYGGRWFGGRFQLTADGAFGKIDRNADGARIGFYARGSIGARMLAATVSSSDHGYTDLVIDAGVGAFDYLLDDGVAVHKPFVYAGWGLQFGFREANRHGGGMMFDVRIAASPHVDDPAVERIVCKGSCPMTATTVDVTTLFAIGITAW